ncbi:MAG TPA: hypothetical protein VNM89_00390, partial [Solirubrobacterales bacterium]|nr:hypothetical protein [Solirubrobacterales bacterium]
MASVAVVSSVDTQRGTARDHDSKSAIAAADAGASVALLRLNRYASALTTAAPCLGVSGSTLVVTGAAGDGWCPAIAGTVGDATYSYRVSPIVAAGTLTVVSTGTAGAVGRRIALSFRTATVGRIFGEEGLIGVDDVVIDENADARVGVGTNGNIYVQNNGNVCGNARHGVGKGATFDENGTQCSGYSVTEGNVTLPPVSSFIPTDIATNNYNRQLVKCTSPGIPLDCQKDSYVTDNGRGPTSTVPWDPSTRAITTANNATLTLTGGDYFICSLSLNNNSHLIIASEAPVRIFFDTPENCGLEDGDKQIDIQNNSDITATGYQPTEDKFNLPGFYLLGSERVQTYASWSNNAGNAEMVLYAPNTDIELKNNAIFTGAIAGKTIHLDNNVVVEGAAPEAIPDLGGATLFARQSYVECTGATASPPNANC